MNDESMNENERRERPVWSHKAEGGYLGSFLAGGEASQAEEEATPAPADERPLEARVIEALRQIYDPEIPVNIYELGLIYGVEVDAANNVGIAMTLTTPHCPVAETMPEEVRSKLLAVEGVNAVDVDLVWNPPWDMSRMSDEARLELGLL